MILQERILLHQSTEKLSAKLTMRCRLLQLVRYNKSTDIMLFAQSFYVLTHFKHMKYAESSEGILTMMKGVVGSRRRGSVEGWFAAPRQIVPRNLPNLPTFVMTERKLIASKHLVIEPLEGLSRQEASPENDPGTKNTSSLFFFLLLGFMMHMPVVY